jgi:hypothetical protein
VGIQTNQQKTVAKLLTMKNINKIKETIIWLLVIAPFIYALIVWKQAPSQMATHFDAQGHPNDYSNKAFALLIIPFVNLALYFILFFIPLIDPRYHNYRLFGSSYQNIRLLIHVLMVGFYVYAVQVALLNGNVNNKFILAGILIFLALMGNYLRTVRSNFFVGIRTPWTLSNDEVWKKTHEFGGKIWFYGGLTEAIIILFLPSAAAVIVMASTAALMGIIPVVYSYVLYRRIMGAPSKE